MRTFSSIAVNNGKVRRESERKPTHRNAILHYAGTRIPVVLKDISRGGTQIKLNPGATHKTLDGPVQLEIPGLMKLPIDLRWRKDANIGAKFDLPKPRLATLEMQIKRMLSRPGR